MNHCGLLLVHFVIFMALSSIALSRGSGITGYTMKTNPTGSGGCHSSAAMNAVLTIKVPASFTVTETNGIDNAVLRSSLTPIGTSTKAGANGELTQPSAGAGTYAFTYTVQATAGFDTLHATGVSGGFTGSWNHAPRFAITVSLLTGIEEQTAPPHFSLAQNFPNPFNPMTMIEYTVPAPGKHTLTVFDMSGREVKTLVNDFQDPGAYRMAFNGSGLASGVFLCRLTTDSQTAIRKLVLLK
jgi:hypothetical protein